MAPVDEHEPALQELLIPALRMPTFDAGRVNESADLVREREVARTGAGLLVISAAVPFVALVVAYAAFRACRLEVFLFGRYYLDANTGLLASLALLLSAFTSGLAARFGATVRLKKMRGAIAATIALGAAFLVIQGHDFWSKAEHGLLPGARFVPTEEVWSTEAFKREHPAATQLAQRLDARWLTITGTADTADAQRGVPTSAAVSAAEKADSSAYAVLRKIGVLGPNATLASVPSRPRNAHAFWGLYLLMMGAHAAYLLVGLAGWASLLAPSPTGELALPAQTRLDGVILFWQFLTMLWVVLFPLFYLVH